MKLEQACQLHEEIRVIYVVDGWEASLYDREGTRELFTAKGETIAEAVSGLEQLLSPYEDKAVMKLAVERRLTVEAKRSRAQSEVFARLYGLSDESS